MSTIAVVAYDVYEFFLLALLACRPHVQNRSFLFLRHRKNLLSPGSRERSQKGTFSILSVSIMADQSFMFQ